MKGIFIYFECLFLLATIGYAAARRNRMAVAFLLYAVVVVIIDVLLNTFKIRIRGTNHFFYNLYLPVMYCFFYNDIL